MAGLERLQAIIYHEKQQEGSMLCAQHALNSLLQGNMFTAPDLSQIATTMDELEESYDDANMGQTSTNMDDTGFFSVQVLERALNVWGLALIRWRSEDMRPYQDHPHTQLAFILNYHQHWFTLRRFGPAMPSMADDPGDGHWFNLNSFLPAPEWVGKLYLGMVLQQAESEGYSVFAVVQADPTATLALTRIDADDVAATLPEPSSSRGSIPHLSTVRTPVENSASASGAAGSGHFAAIEGFEEEDMELQAALQASLGGGGDFNFVLPPRIPPQVPMPPPRGFPTRSYDLPSPSEIEFPNTVHTPMPDMPSPELSPVEDVDSLDPVARSMARNKLIMERMRREQEMALREQYEAEVAAAPAGSTGSRRRAPRQEEDDEDEMLRRAIAESEALARENAENDDEAIDEDDSDDDDEYVSPLGSPPLAPIPVRTPLPDTTAPQPAYMSHRVYDDDDAELQAALKASLEHMPEGFVIPEVPPMPSLPLPRPAPPASGSSTAPPLRRAESLSSDTGTSMSAGTEMEVEQPEEKIDVDEMRRRRLARFGG